MDDGAAAPGTPGTLVRVRHDEITWTDDLSTVDRLVRSGLNRRTVRARIAAGTWLEPFPGVVCRTTGQLTSSQAFTGAVLYAGPGGTLSCASAGSFWGFGSRDLPVHVTVGHGIHRRSTDLVVVHQSRRPVEPRLVEDWLVTPPARTAVDIALEARTLDAARAVLGRAVQTRRVNVLDLSDELDLAPSRGSRFPRLAMAEIGAGAHGAAEARLVSLVARSRLPPAEYNAAVQTAAGTRYVDALWRALAKGVEVDGRAFHLDAASWAADLARQNAIQSVGIVLLRIPASRLWTEPDAVLAEITAFLGVHP